MKKYVIFACLLAFVACSSGTKFEPTIKEYVAHEIPGIRPDYHIEVLKMKNRGIVRDLDSLASGVPNLVRTKS